MNKWFVYMWIHRARIALSLAVVFIGVVLLLRIKFEGPFGLFTSSYGRFSETSSFKSVKFTPPMDDTSASRTSASKSGFVQYMHHFSWDILANENEPRENRIRLITDLIGGLSEFATLEPRVPVSNECSSPPPLPQEVDCTAFPDGLSGVRRPAPVRIAHMIQFGFEVDVLEIHLRELYDVVDYFFILESTRAQYETVIKPLLWEKVRLQARFRPFLDKVVHIIVDDIDSAVGSSADNKNIWYLERLQERTRFEKFLVWNSKQANPFTEDDMIGFGDADEVSDRNNIWLLKHCYPKKPATDIGIWFPVGKLTNAFETDWPVPGHPYALGDPTFHTMKSALAEKARGSYPSRNRGKSGAFLLGGMHMTRHRFLPYMLLESITCSECGWGDPSFIKKIQTIMMSNDVDEMVRWWDEHHTGRMWLSAKDEFWMNKTERESLMKIPSFLKCNPDRYPYWTDGHDTRLDLPAYFN